MCFCNHDVSFFLSSCKKKRKTNYHYLNCRLNNDWQKSIKIFEVCITVIPHLRVKYTSKVQLCVNLCNKCIKEEVFITLEQGQIKIEKIALNEQCTKLEAQMSRYHLPAKKDLITLVHKPINPWAIQWYNID